MQKPINYVHVHEHVHNDGLCETIVFFNGQAFSSRDIDIAYDVCKIVGQESFEVTTYWGGKMPTRRIEPVVSDGLKASGCDGRCKACGGCGPNGTMAKDTEREQMEDAYRCDGERDYYMPHLGGNVDAEIAAEKKRKEELKNG